MVERLQRFRKLAPALVVLALSSCSSSSDGFGDGGATVGSSAATDASIKGDIVVIVAGADAAPVADAVDCLPFSPPIPCAQGTACPGDSYCDLKQTPPICTKLHCQPNGTACDMASRDGIDHCMSHLCLSGVCASPVGEGSSCAHDVCADGLRCLGYPLTCVKPQPIGGVCQDDNWCANNTTLIYAVTPSQVVYCLAGVCGTSYCNATGTNADCGSGGTCDPGYSCLGVCAALYCGQDGIQCTSDALCATGFGCVDSRCRKLKVAPHCVGTPTYVDCSVAALAAIPGCTVTVNNCSGTALSCATHTNFGSRDCAAQVGCQWDDSTHQCMGTARPCSELTGAIGGCAAGNGCPADGCSIENGCTPSKTISGSPTPCNQLSTADCTSQLGCKVTDIGIY